MYPSIGIFSFCAKTVVEIKNENKIIQKHLFMKKLLSQVPLVRLIFFIAAKFTIIFSPKPK